MPRLDGSLARKLDFGEMTTTTGHPGRGGLRLALSSGARRGPDKYRELEHRRRQAQIKARRQIDLLNLE